MRIIPRALPPLLAGVVGLSGVTVALAPPAAADLSALKINEVFSAGVDFVELVNTGDAPLDLHGLKFIDGGAGAPVDLVTASTLLAPGAYHSFEPDTAWNIGLGKGDSATILAADGTTVIDTVTWPAGTHAEPSYGRCADGTGPFVVNNSATRRAPNDCPSPFDPIVINELRSNDAAGGPDFVELTNTGEHPIDVSSLAFVDGDETHAPIPFAAAGTTIAPSEHLSFETEAINGGAGYGLGKGDSVTILDGSDVVDTFTIAAASTPPRR